MGECRKCERDRYQALAPTLPALQLDHPPLGASASGCPVDGDGDRGATILAASYHLVPVQVGARLMGIVMVARPYWQPPMRAQPLVMSHHTVRDEMPAGIWRREEGGKGQAGISHGVLMAATPHDWLGIRIWIAADLLRLVYCFPHRSVLLIPQAFPPGWLSVCTRCSGSCR